MDLIQFWTLIDASVAFADQPHEQRRWLVNELAARPESELVSYKRRFFEQIDRAYHYDLWSAVRLIDEAASDDSFYYFRDYWVARGKSKFERAISDPDSLVDEVNADGYLPYNEMHFASAGDDAYRVQQGKPNDYSLWLPFEYVWKEEPDGEWVDFNSDEAIRAAFPRIWQHRKEWGKTG